MSYAAKFKDALRKDLESSGESINPEQFLKNCLKKSVPVSIAALIILSLATSLAYALLFSTVLFFAVTSYYVKAPRRRLEKLASEVEKHVPLACKALSVDLLVGVPFHSALENISRQDYGALSRELRKVLRESRTGLNSFQESIKRLSERLPSTAVKRFALHLISAYETGFTSSELSSLNSFARDELSLQKLKVKEFSGKLVFYSLIFIMVSAILPAMLQVLLLIGSTLLSINASFLQVILLFSVVLPLLNVLVLALIKAATPAFFK